MEPEEPVSNPNEPSSSGLLHRFFAGLAEHVFQCQLGVADLQLVEYVTDLLDLFVRSEQQFRVRRPTGQPATEVVEMLFEADRRIGLARREVHRHIGDYTLFWAGLYPESLRQLQSSTSSDHFLDYCQQGRRAYAIASEIRSTAERPPSNDLLRRLSEQFDLCAYGLREIRRQWEATDEDPDGNRLLFG
jgi:hypothetical protein